jgi:hypothetical protein
MMQSSLSFTAASSGTVPEYAFVPNHAPFVAIAFLGLGASLLAAAGAAGLCLALCRRRLALGIAAAASGAALLYGVLLFGLALTSRDRLLPAGGRKYFCEIDCHLAYSVAGVLRSRTVGAPPSAVMANGRFIAVRVRTWFDPETIASFRGNGPLTPNPREAWIVDAAGRRYRPSPAATKAFENTQAGCAPFTRILRPDESYETALVFDLPEEARGARLFVGDPPGVENLLLGHENGAFHGKTYFDLGS